MTPYSRFTLFHSSLPVEGLVVENPIGWDTAVISLERHKDYHSLIEEFKGNFLWYGLGMSTLKQIESDFGFNAVVRLTIDLSYKPGVYINLFTGKIKLQQIEEIMIADREHYKMTAPIIRDDFWTKFIDRSDSQVNLESTTDLDGGTRTAVNKIVLPMPSQKVRSKYRAEEDGTAIPTLVSEPYVQYQPYNIKLDEVLNRFDLPNSRSAGLPVSVFSILYEGVYTFDLRIEASHKLALSYQHFDSTYELDFFIQVNDETPDTFSRVDNIGVYTIVSPITNLDTTVFTFSGVKNLKVGDQVRIYGQNVGATNFAFYAWGTLGVRVSASASVPGYYPRPVEMDSVPTYFEIECDTIYEDTETDAYLIKDAAESIVSKLVGQNAAVKSDYLDTCKGYNAIFRGKHVRGYDFATKQFSMSWEEWWKGANPLLFLGLGYTEVLGVKKIEIEERAYFYDPVPAVNISNVNKLVRRYDLERIYKSIELKFKKSLSESESGIDDPQTSRFWNTDLPGVKETIMCEWMAASLAIERSRRNRVELGKDDRNDEEIMVVALVEDGADWLPEFGTAFNAITNLLNSDFRINVRHSATRLFKRAQSWFNGCMVYSDTGTFTFNRGEGNYEMTSQLEESDCEAVSGTEPVIDEGGDIAAETSDIIFVPRIYEAESVPMSFETYQQIVANKNKALGISRTDTDHVPMHILDLGFTIFKSESSLLLLQATEDGL